MTNSVIGEVYGLAQSAVGNGQRYMPVHVFPFRMTDENLVAHSGGPWGEFWTDLKRGYQSFERHAQAAAHQRVQGPVCRRGRAR